MERNPWVILGVEINATDAEIKSAFRKLAKDHHPDKNRGDKNAKNRFHEITRAYESIATEEKRSSLGGTFPAMQSPFPDLDETMRSPVRNPPPAPTVPKPASPLRAQAEYTLNLTFPQAYKGHSTTVEVRAEGLCDVCGGTGSAPGYKPRTCDLCSGSGRHRAGRVVNDCAQCNGQGFIIVKPCTVCEAGKVRRNTPIRVSVPPGAYTGYQMTQKNSGVVLNLSINVEASPIFKPKDPGSADLVIEVPVSYTEAVLGAAVRVPTPSKSISLKIPPGTQPGKLFRIPEEGMPVMGSNEMGDLYAKINLFVPKNPAAKYKKALEELNIFEDEAIRNSLFIPTAE